MSGEQDIAKLVVDATGVETGLGKAETSIVQFSRVMSKLDKDLDAMTRHMRSSATELDQHLDKIGVSTTGAMSNALKAGRENLQQAKLTGGENIGVVRAQTAALKFAMEARLTTLGKLSDAELRIWQSFGVSIGGVGKAQLKGIAIEELATQLRVSDLSSVLQALELKHSTALKGWKTRYAKQIAETKAALASETSELLRLAEARQLDKVLSSASIATLKTKAPYSRLSDRMEINAPLTGASIATLKTKAPYSRLSDRTVVNAALMPQPLVGPVMPADWAKQQAEEVARYEASLKSLAAKQELADKRYIALRKDSLARGKVLIVGEAKNKLAELNAANKIVNDEEVARYEASLKSLAAKQELADKRYIALRKDSLARGKVLIVAAARNNLIETNAAIAQQTKILTDANIATFKATAPYSRLSDRTVVNAALMPQPFVGPIQPLGDLGLKAKDTANKLSPLSEALKKLKIDGNDAHSAMRGLASGFNLLWLTWGNLVPLFAGAVISNGFMQTAKTGMEVAHTMAIIANLGENSAQSMALLNEELIRLGKSGPQGPKEIAEAMKVLSLAGLEANEILAVTQTVLNFSVAGTTDLKTAADTLVSLTTAFGYGIEGFQRVSDVVAKTAAVSKSSVESISNAMKTASVINAQYGVSLTDTATGLAALSQLGIEGTAAGTALRNMYADLSGRSEQVAKVLKQQGIEMRDSTGAFRPMLEVVADLNTKLNKLTGIDKQNLLQKILSERGAKGIVEMLRMINTEVEDSAGKLTNALAKSNEEILNSYGFATIQAAKMAQTTKNQFLSVKATLQTSMTEAFAAMEPQLLDIAYRLKEAFGSPEFVSGLSWMVTNLARLAATVIENSKVLATAATAYGVWRVALALSATTLGHKTLVLMGLTKAKVADTAATLANTAAEAANTAGKMTQWVGLARVIPYLGQVITLGTAAWVAYDFFMGEASKTAENAEKVYTDKVVKALEDETAKLKKLNELRAQGLSLQEAELRLKREGAIQPLSIKTATLQQEYDDLKAKHASLEARATKGGLSLPEQTQANVEAARASRAMAAKYGELRRSYTEYYANSSAIDRAATANAKESKIAADRLDAEMKAKKTRFDSLLGAGTLPETDTGSDSALSKRVSDIESLNRSIREFEAGTRAITETEAKQTEGTRWLIKAQEDLNKVSAVGSKQHKEDLAALEKVAAARDTANYRKDLLDFSSKELQAMEDKLTKQKEITDAIGLTKVEVDNLRAAQAELAAQAMDVESALLASEAVQAAAGEYAGAYSQRANDLKKMAQTLREVEAEYKKAGIKQAAYDAKVEWTRTSKAIEDKLVDGMWSAVEQGKGLFVGLRDSLEDIFAKMILRPIVQGVITDVGNMLVGGDTAGKGGAFGNTISGLSGLSKAYDFLTSGKVTSWFTDFQGSVTGVIDNLGRSISSFGEIGGKAGSTMWKVGETMSEWAPTVGKIANYAGYALAAYNAFDAASKGKWGQAVGTGVGAIWGPLGSAVGGAIGGWIDGMFGGGTQSQIGQGISGTFSKTGLSGQNYTRMRNSGQSGFFGIGATSAREWDVTSAMSTGTQAQLSTSFFLLQLQTAAFAKTLGESTDSITNYTKGFTVALGADAAANQAAIAALFTTMANEMATAIVKPEFIRQGESAADALGRLGTNLLQVNAAFDLMGKTKLAGTQAGGNTASNLVDMFGGLDKFNSAQSAFYNAYYTDTEKKAKLTEQLTRSFKEVGYDLPTTREAYKQMVLNQEVVTSSGQSTYASLLSLSVAFATLTDTANKATAALSETNFATEVAYLRFKGRLGLGSSVADLQKVPGFASGGEHSGGWRVVGERGSELEYTGPSQIVNHNDSLFDTSELVAEIRQLRMQVAALERTAAATYKVADKEYKLHDKWDSEGIPAERT